MIKIKLVILTMALYSTLLHLPVRSRTVKEERYYYVEIYH